MAGTIQFNAAVKGATSTVAGVAKMSDDWRANQSGTSVSSVGIYTALTNMLKGDTDAVVTLTEDTTSFTENQVVQDINGKFWMATNTFITVGGYPDGLVDDNFEEVNIRTVIQKIKEVEDPYTFITVTDFDTDYELKQAYYEIVDNNNNWYNVHVGSDLYIEEGNVITAIAGYVRLQGIELPAQLAIRDYPTITGNTTGETYLELVSNFDDDGNTVATKSLEK